MLVAFICAIFLSLADWQWQRAYQLKHPPAIDQTLQPLDSVTGPGRSLTDNAIGKHVSIKGTYITSWKAPNQDGKKIWSVGLLRTLDNAAILVVRGEYKPSPTPTGEVSVTGILLPPQSQDRTSTEGEILGRVDSALVVNKTNLPLYAGFINELSENPPSGLNPIKIKQNNAVPGFYWQHISYVVIWLLFALTTVYLALYQRRLTVKEGF